MHPAPGSRLPIHRRTINIEAFATELDNEVDVVGSFLDERPWAEPPISAVVHRMTLTLRVRVPQMMIVDAHADMHEFPHVECPAITPAFRGLIGLSVARGYNKEVQKRFLGVTGCAHLEFLSRAMGPAVVQTTASLRAMERAVTGVAPVPNVNTYMKNTCHVWADDGPAVQKIELGWRPGLTEVPVPTPATVRRILAERDS